MQFNVANRGKGPRFVKTAAGRTVVVVPGEEKQLDLDPAVAKAMFAISQRPAKNVSSIRLTAIDAAGNEALTGKRAPAPKMNIPGTEPLFLKEAADAGDDEGRSPYTEEGESVLESSQTPAESLLERADELELDELRAEAKEVLGKNAPKDLARLKRAAVKRLLKS